MCQWPTNWTVSVRNLDSMTRSRRRTRKTMTMRRRRRRRRHVTRRTTLVGSNAMTSMCIVEITCGPSSVCWSNRPKDRITIWGYFHTSLFFTLLHPFTPSPHPSFLASFLPCLPSVQNWLHLFHAVFKLGRPRPTFPPSGRKGEETVNCNRESFVSLLFYFFFVSVETFSIWFVVVVVVVVVVSPDESWTKHGCQTPHKRERDRESVFWE